MKDDSINSLLGTDSFMILNREVAILLILFNHLYQKIEMVHYVVKKVNDVR